MNRILRHISIFAAIVAIVACSMVEMPDNLHENKTVEFVVRNTTFSSIDVSVASTKALTGTELTAVERKIVNAYFLVFGEDGTLEEFRTLEVTDNTIPSQTLTHDYDNGPIKVCYLANVSEDVASSYKTWDDILTKPLEITYPEYNEAYFSTTGHVGIPSLDGELCFPMFNSVTYPGAPASNGVVEVQLERLFAKVVVNLSTDFETGGGLGGFIGGIFDAPNLTLHSYKVTNLPTNVILNNQEIENSSWVTYDNTQDGKEYFKAPINVDIEDITVSNDFLIETPQELLTLYVPEYYLAPKSTASNNTDQKLKPTMFDESKRPVFITITGLAHQSNFVDVPLEYNIYLGEDAVKDFDLRRNRQYNNNMTVTGTGEAILGTDTRVEPTYHNLADPTNSGTLNPANCYIISKPGRYLIPTYVGNDVSQLLSGKSAEVLSLNGSANNRIDNIGCITIDGKNYIQFDVNMFDAAGNPSLTDVAGGNKLLVLKDASGQIIWSWHLWLSSNSNRPDEYHHIYPETEAEVMNRALGSFNNLGTEGLGISLAYWDDGFYYQWGRKDPFMQSGNATSSSASYAKAKQNPRTFYTDWNGTYTTENGTNAIGWTSTKSVNDPCPPGYKVPSNDIWRATPSSSDGMENIMEGLGNIIPGLSGYPYNYNASLDISHNVMYPYSGHLNNGVLDGVSDKQFTNRVASQSPISGMEIRVVFSGTDYIYSGELWSYTGGLYFSRSKTDITKSDIYVKISNNWYPRTPDNNNPNGYTVGNIETSILNSFGTGFLQQIAKAAVQAAFSLLKNTLGFSIDGFVESILESMVTVRHEYDRKLQSDADAIPLTYGAHVRCVRE